MLERFGLDINPECKVNAFKTFFLSENSSQFDFSSYDYVIDCIDTISAKVQIALMAQNSNTRVISSMGAGNKLNPLEFEVTDIYKTSVCPLARVMRGLLKKAGVKKLKVVYSKENLQRSKVIQNTQSKFKAELIQHQQFTTHTKHSFKKVIRRLQTLIKQSQLCLMRHNLFQTNKQKKLRDLRIFH